MVEIIWEFVVKEEARGQFELAYGPGGAWSKLFARSPVFRGTTLLRDTKNPGRYLAIDFWETEAQREQVLAERKAEYSNLDAAFANWTESRTEVGVFRVPPPWQSRTKQSWRGRSQEPPNNSLKPTRPAGENAPVSCQPSYPNLSPRKG
jgi:heme-degrading monooxygenase HmoA